MTAPDSPQAAAPSTRRAGLEALRLGLALIGLCSVALLAVPASDLAEAMAHPARRAADGSPAEVTAAGAAYLRQWVPIAGVALAALMLLGDRWLQGGPRSDEAADPTSAAQPAADVHTPISPREWLALAVATLVALAIRLPFVADSLWYDEIAAFLGYGVHGPMVAIGNYYTQANHVLQGALSALSAQALGTSELALRLPSLVAGVALVPAVWWLAREATAPAAPASPAEPAELASPASPTRIRRAPLIAAWAAALLPIAVLEATEARGYALTMLLAALCTACLLWAWRARHAAPWGLYAVLCALGVWSHLVFACVPAAHALWALTALLRGPQRGPALRTLVALALAAVVTVALYSPVLPDMAGIRREFAAADGDEPTLIGPQGLEMLLMLGGTWTWWASLTVLPALAVGAATALRNRRLRLAAMLTGGGALLALLAPLAFDSWLYARFVAFVAAAVALVMGAGVAATWTRSRPAALAMAALAVAGWLAGLSQLPPRQPLREAMAYIAQMQREGDRALAMGLPDDVHAYYAAAFGVRMPGTGPYGRDLEAMLPIVEPRFILVLYPHAQPVARLELLRAAGYQPVLRLPGWIDQGGGEVAVFERAPDQS